MENEKRLIDANALLENTDVFTMHTKEYGSIEVVPVDAIGDAPTVDAVEVVHGHWREFIHSALVRWKDGEPVWADRSVFRCSRCDFGTIARHNYCPRCGAKMDGGNEDG